MLARSTRLSLAAGIAGPASAMLLSGLALAGDVQMVVPKWDDPELKAYFASAPKAAPESAGPADQIKLPVLELREPPENVKQTMGASPQAVAEPEIIYDPDNPVWYQATHNYGDVTVTIEADLRVRSAAPGTMTFESTTQGAQPSEEPEVIVYDDAEAEGTPGYFAEYTIEKFGVPYTVRVECTAAVKAECADKAKVAATAALLTVKGGNPGK
jgi:hypothetical protein